MGWFEGRTGASPYAFGVLWASTTTMLLALFTVVVDAVDGAVDDPAFLIVGVGAGIAALLSGRQGVAPRRAPGVVVVTSVVVCWLTMVGWSTFAYLLTGTFGRFDNALFESMAGYSTTHLSVIGEFDQVTGSAYFWRAGTQWLGGLTALLTGAVLLPFWVGGREMSDPGGRRAGFRALAPTPAMGVRNIAKFYIAFTLVAWGMLGVSGAGIRDGLTYAMSTVSTGGFSTHPDSLSWFDSAALEWVTAGLMFVAGTSAAMIWWLMRGSARPLLRSVELRVYVGAVAAASLVFALADAQAGSSPATAARHGVVTATAVLSTTGHWVTDWTPWGTGVQFLLLLLVSIGSMAGSLGGGYRWLQVIETVKFVRRELTLLLHPTANVSIRVGDRFASERSLDQMNAQRTLLIGVVAIGSVLLSIFGLEIDVSVPAAVSAVSTFGPGLGELAASSDALQFDASARWVLAALMFAGRLSVYPIFLALGTAAEALRRQSLNNRADARGARNRPGGDAPWRR